MLAMTILGLCKGLSLSVALLIVYCFIKAIYNNLKLIVAKYCLMVHIVVNYTVQSSVIPAEAGIHNPLIFLDSRFRGNDDLDNMIFRFMWLGRTLDCINKNNKNGV